jgi:hypothetical protein
MDLATRIQQLEDMIREAKNMPLSSSALISREEVLEVVVAMREELPEEVKQARWVVRDREELLVKARHDADVIIEKGRQEQARLVQKQEVVQAANDEAERIVAEARERARRTRLEAEDYCDSKLAQFEIAIERIQEALGQSHQALADSLQRVRGALIKTSEQVTGGREKLRGVAHPARALGPADEEEPEEVAGT